MPALREIQKSLANFMTLPQSERPERHFESAKFHVTDLLNIHRNNFRITLSDALAANFPALFSLLDEECFNAYAALYVESNPPISPLLSAYGATFPDFLEKQVGLEDYPYLADIGRLEGAWNAAFHAKDAIALTPQELQEGLPTGIDFKLHPAVRIIHSKFVISTIWRAARNPEDSDPDIRLEEGDEYLLISRPDYDANVSQIDVGTYAMLSAMQASDDFINAVEIALIVSPEFSLEGSLANLLVRGTFTSQTSLEKE